MNSFLHEVYTIFHIKCKSVDSNKNRCQRTRLHDGNHFWQYSPRYYSWWLNEGI